ncbi:acyl-ACP thioesterase domain-containing protein [uncultured Clostridium sp.]|uniref:acyl-[acyl-carrier-protein] thioesterase n=1 Tax=uncultured Clostridium sp. TaxID=59620 RepID=UPI00260A07D2|nr:acyl-ACP thioesterase domain-containing protein [uncultured Clostridium sp.]
MGKPFFKDYKINIYDVDCRHYCKFSTLVDYLWDVVIEQSDALGETKEGFVHNDCVWVLLKYDINIYKYPKFKDTVTVSTEVIGYKKVYGYRHYTIKDSDGNLLAEADSIAILIDFNRRRPMKITPDQCEVYGLEKELENPPKLDDLITLENTDFSSSHIMSYSDIDSNNHVNNVRYMEMALNSLPKEILNDYDVTNIKVLFKKETTIGNTVSISSQVIQNSQDEVTTLHNIEEEKLLVKLQIKWNKTEDKTLF